MQTDQLTHDISPSPPKWQLAIWVLSSVIGYAVIAYFIPRQSFFSFLGVYALLFTGYFWIIPRSIHPQGILALGVLFRLTVLFALPVLSDDYFRFIWDGKLIANGVNPFAQLPSEIMQSPDRALNLGLTSELFQGLNSPDYFTIYPPVLQGIFYTSVKLFPKSILEAVWVMKLFIFLAEVGSLALIGKLLIHFRTSSHLLSIYAFNPLIVIELTGNLHFEALMIFFLLWAVWLLVKEKWLWSILPFAMAVGSKLLPVIILPLFLRRLGWRETMVYGIGVFILLGIMFWPILDLDTISHLFASIGLYYQKFEFNASIYYLARGMGYQLTGYNMIQVIGKFFALLTLAGIFTFAFLEKESKLNSLPKAILWVFLIYLSLASIVHPWYISVLIAFGTFTRFRWPLVWSLLISLSYYAYRTDAYAENLWLVGFEYFVLAGWIIFELLRAKNNRENSAAEAS